MIRGRTLPFSSLEVLASSSLTLLFNLYRFHRADREEDKENALKVRIREREESSLIPFLPFQILVDTVTSPDLPVVFSDKLLNELLRFLDTQVSPPCILINQYSFLNSERWSGCELDLFPSRIDQNSINGEGWSINNHNNSNEIDWCSLNHNCSFSSQKTISSFFPCTVKEYDHYSFFIYNSLLFMSFDLNLLSLFQFCMLYACWVNNLISKEIVIEVRSMRTFSVYLPIWVIVDWN